MSSDSVCPLSTLQMSGVALPYNAVDVGANFALPKSSRRQPGIRYGCDFKAISGRRTGKSQDKATLDKFTRCQGMGQVMILGQDLQKSLTSWVDGHCSGRPQGSDCGL